MCVFLEKIVAMLNAAKKHFLNSGNPVKRPVKFLQTVQIQLDKQTLARTSRDLDTRGLDGYRQRISKYQYTCTRTNKYRVLFH